MTDSRGARLEVVHLINGLGQGGAEALLVTYLGQLVRSAANTLVTVFEPPVGGYFWADSVRRLGVEMVSLGARPGTDLAVAALRMTRFLYSRRPSLVHAHLTHACHVARAACTLTRTPLVTTMHNVSYEPEVLAQYRNPSSRKHDVARAMEGLATRLDARVIAVSQTVARSAIERLWLRPDQVRVILNPIDFARHDAAPGPSRAELAREANVPEAAHWILFVGRLTAQKGLLEAIEAVGLLKAKGFEAHLVLLGSLSDTTYVQALRARAVELGVENLVSTPGPRHDVPAWLRAAKAFLLPSHYEGLPLALAEAAGMGCVCVASDIPSNREVVENKVTGLLFPPRDPRAMAEALARVLGDADLGARLSTAARDSARRRFDLGSATADMLDTYRSVVAPR